MVVATCFAGCVGGVDVYMIFLHVRGWDGWVPGVFVYGLFEFEREGCPSE